MVLLKNVSFKHKLGKCHYVCDYLLLLSLFMTFIEGKYNSKPNLRDNRHKPLAYSGICSKYNNEVCADLESVVAELARVLEIMQLF